MKFSDKLKIIWRVLTFGFKKSDKNSELIIYTRVKKDNGGKK